MVEKEAFVPLLHKHFTLSASHHVVFYKVVAEATQLGASRDGERTRPASIAASATVSFCAGLLK